MSVVFEGSMFSLTGQLLSTNSHHGTVLATDPIKLNVFQHFLHKLIHFEKTRWRMYKNIDPWGDGFISAHDCLNDKQIHL